MDRNQVLFRTQQFVQTAVLVICTLLLFRFVLKLLGANPAATFTDIVYSLSGVFLVPFQFVFSNDVVSGAVIEWSTVLALIVYWGLGEILTTALSAGRTEDQQSVQRELRAHS